MNEPVFRLAPGARLGAPWFPAALGADLRVDLTPPAIEVHGIPTWLAVGLGALALLVLAG